MKHLVSKLGHALATKDWRLVEDVRNMLEGRMEWPKPNKAIEHPYTLLDVTHNID